MNEAFTLDGFTVARLGPDDAPEVQDLWERCADFHELQEGTPPRPTIGAEELAALPPGKTMADKHDFAVRAPDGTTVGFVDLVQNYPADGEWWLGLLMLDPAWRSRGLGARIYRAAAAWARSRGATAIGLGVLERNAAAERFWARHGFVERQRKDWTSDHGHTQRVVLMRHDLTAIDAETSSDDACAGREGDDPLSR